MMSSDNMNAPTKPGMRRPKAPPTHVATPGGKMAHYVHAALALSDAELLELRRRIRAARGEVPSESGLPPLPPLPKG